MNETANLFCREQSNMQLNACVGTNGWRGMFAYIDGYQSATLAMLESILSQHTPEADYNRPEQAFLWNVDTAIYPILFTARHFIELYIKQKIYTINYFKIKEDINEKLIKTHDIQKLWDIFVNIVDRTKDSRLDRYVKEIAPYIQDFNRIDPTGETFRYPYSSQGSMHLKDMGVIGVYNFYNKFNLLSKVCETFTFQMDYLVEEYRVETFTKRLSRENIEYIAKKLPIFEEWKQPSFSSLKTALKTQLSIGSKELSEAIDIIKNHLEFKRYIYPDAYELQIEKSKLYEVVAGNMSLDDFYNFEVEEIASLRAIVELGTPILDGVYFSEDYISLYEEYLQESESSDYEKQSNYEYSIRHINRLNEGLNKINYSDLVNSI